MVDKGIPIIGQLTQGDLIFNDWWKKVGHKQGLKDKASAKAAFFAGILCCQHLLADMIANQCPVSQMLSIPVDMDIPKFDIKKGNGQ